MCRTASVAVRCSRPACSAGSPILGAAAASAVKPASLRNRLRFSIAPRFYTAPVCLAIVSRALDTGVTLATGGAETPRLFGASAAGRMGGLDWVEHYFEGCSNGGRQAMQEAERYPADFDGIIAGAPALDWVGTMTGFVWNEQAVNAAPLSIAKVALLAGAVLAQCDAKDGLMDGLISDPRRCGFDPKTVQCPTGDAPTCLTAGRWRRPGASITAPRAPRAASSISGGRRGTRTAPRPAGRSGPPATERSRRCSSSSRTAI